MVAVDRIQIVIHVQISPECLITRKVLFRCHHALHQHRVMHPPHPLFQPRGDFILLLFPLPLKSHFSPKHFWAKSSAESASTKTAGGGTSGKQVTFSSDKKMKKGIAMERQLEEIKLFRMLEEAVCTLKEQVNIYEQEVDQVCKSFYNLKRFQSNAFQIKEQSRIKESNFEEEISILKTQVKSRPNL